MWTMCRIYAVHVQKLAAENYGLVRNCEEQKRRASAEPLISTRMTLGGGPQSSFLHARVLLL